MRCKNILLPNTYVGMTEGNVFRGVCLSVHRETEGVSSPCPGSVWASPVQILSEVEEKGVTTSFSDPVWGKGFGGCSSQVTSPS